MFVVLNGFFFNDFQHMLNAPGLEMRHNRSNILSGRLAASVLEFQFNNANAEPKPPGCPEEGLGNRSRKQLAKARGDPQLVGTSLTPRQHLVSTPLTPR